MPYTQKDTSNANVCSWGYAYCAGRVVEDFYCCRMTPGDCRAVSPEASKDGTTRGGRWLQHDFYRHELLKTRRAFWKDHLANRSTTSGAHFEHYRFADTDGGAAARAVTVDIKADPGML